MTRRDAVAPRIDRARLLARTITHMASACLVLCIVFVGTAGADIVDTVDDFAPKPLPPPSAMGDSAVTVPGEALINRLNASRAIQPLGGEVFGESVDPMSFNLRFFQTDVLLQGTGPDIAIQRSLDVNAARSGIWPREHAFGEWKLELPRMSTGTPPLADLPIWQVAGSQPNARCSNFGIARSFTREGYLFPASEWWQGVQLTIPGEGSQEVLKRAVQNPIAPTMTSNGNALTFPLVTTEHWMISCLPATSNGQLGEAFLAVSPQGDKYWFDHLVIQSYEVVPLPYHSVSIGRYVATMLPSRIEDRHGNSLVFSYDGARLTGIVASDGRAISLAWQSVNTLSFITMITEQPGDPQQRTWTYSYKTPPLGRTLNKVTLPDSSAWTFNFDEMTRYCAYWAIDFPQNQECSDHPGDWGENEGTAIAPSGLVGTFKISNIFLPRILDEATMPASCFHEGTEGFWEVPVVAVTSKRYSGAGVDDTWKYTFCANDVCNVPEPQAGISPFGIENPDGTVIVQSVDRRWCSANLGDVVRIDINPKYENNTYVSSERVIRSQRAPADTGPFPAVIGTVPQTYANRAQLETLRPIRQRDIVQDGATFTWSAESFDTLGRPLNVKRASTLGTSRSETIGYHDNSKTWLLGQIASVKEPSTAAPMLARTFDAVTGNVLTQSHFGALQQTLAWYANGLVQSVADGAGHITVLSNYKRGVAQTIAYADGTSTAAVVDNLGQIESTTDENGYTTNYLYDPVGRLKKTIRPTNDSTIWNPTDRVFAPVNVAEYGLAAGHWRLTETTGNAHAITYFDARWRPVLSRSFDNADEANTRRMTLRRFDTMNRETFASYPQRSIASVLSTPPGIATTYDAIDRPRSVVAASELGPLTTTIDYLAGFKRRTTNPRGHQTTATFRAFDNPDAATLFSLLEPEGIATVVIRDVFGKPIKMTRSGPWNNGMLEDSRSYVYDNAQRLCKTIDAETGTTVIDYDAAGNIAWQATGQSQPSLVDCQRAGVPASQRSNHLHDARNRLTAINHPADAADLGYTWFPDGALRTAATSATANAPASLWTYAYNKRRLPTSETLAFDGKNSVVTHAYDANAAPASLTTPSGLAIAFAPNALGQPTKAATYVTTASYHPNGAIAGWSYGNGAVREHLLNTRQLPDRLRDTRNGIALLDHTFDYDENGNLVARLDGVPSGLENSELTYDARDRLRTAIVPNKFGIESFEYDPLDNIRRAVIGGLDLRYGIDTKNRLADIKLGGETLHAYTWNTRGALATRSRPGEPDPQGLFRDGFETGGDVLPPLVQTYVFDSANRLARINGLERYAYDAHGHRLRIRRDTGTVRDELRDRSGRLLYTEDTRDQQRTDYIALGTTLVAKRTRPLNGNTATTTYLHPDARGTPSVESNATGQTILRTRLTPYGAPYDGIWRDGPGFTGHTADAASQLVYMQQRYFGPLELRFLSPDPVSASPESYNRYWYANNNPYRFVDPDGRWTCDKTGSGCGQLQAAALRIDGALKNGNLSSTERTQLQNARDYIGSYDAPENTVTIRFGTDVPRGAAGYVDKNGNIVLDKSRATRSAAQGNGGSAAENTENAIARNISHEADHAYRFFTKEAWQITRHQLEVEGYRASAIYQKATGWLDIGNNAWIERTGISERILNEQAKASVSVSCNPSSSCE